ncbi:MAG: death-on-curing protein [Pseudomonadota bacterium]|jgi:death-on-curing protein
MSEPLWLTREIVIAAHERQLKRFGGPPGLRDMGMLESALSRPQNKFTYGEEDMAVLAAAYAYGLARNHPFIDGNKRIAFLAMMLFLRRNGIAFAPEPAHATAMILEVAAGNVSEEGLTRWLRDNWPPA